jgi:hypothetical protein
MKTKCLKKYTLLIYLLIIIFYFPIGCKVNNSDKSDSIPYEYLQIVKKHLTLKYNQDYVFFVDLKKPSNQYRFYVLSLIDKKIINKGLCCNGKVNSEGQVIYSNAPGSNCSSKGAYKIGSAYNGSFGKAYKLYGMNETNSNAFARNIVLHSYKGIPRTPSIMEICQSEGCPTVNPDFLNELDMYITKSKTPILLYIY